VRLCHNSHAGAESYRKWLAEPSLKMPVNLNGVDFKGITHASEDKPEGVLYDQIKQLERVRVIGTVARFEPVKQLFLWIDTAQLILLAFPECKFLIVGGGSMLEDCKIRVRAIGLSDAFVFTEQTTAVKTWLDLMDIFLMTSDAEGLPNALIEAQAFGVPVVSTDVGGVREVIVDGVSGRIAAGNSNALVATVVSCLKDPAWLQAASSVAIAHATQKFSMANMNERLEELYAWG